MAEKPTDDLENEYEGKEIPEGTDLSFMSKSDTSIDSPDQVHALEEDKDEDDVKQENLQYGSLVALIEGKFNTYKNRRQSDERRWMEAYRNYRGIYGPDVQFRDNEKSRAFIKITKTKVLAAYGKLTEVLFSGHKFPIGIEPTPVPEGIAESVSADPKAKKDEQKPPEEENVNPPSYVARKDVWERVGGLKKQLERLKDTAIDLEEGPGKTPSSWTWEPAKLAAKKMEKKIHDQLEEANADKALRAFCFEMALFGHGIMKGPLVSSKEYPRWDKSGKYTPIIKQVADLGHTSIWNNYPDPDARSIEECEDWIERHRMSKTQMRRLKKRPHFRSQSIELAIAAGPNYTQEYWEELLEDNDYDGGGENTRYEVIEYWGAVDKEFIEMTDFFEEEIPEEFEDLDQFSINCWTCNGQVLRLVLNPFEPTRIPYYACPYEANPYSFFGVGVAENMMDTQLVMNGFFRLAIDNAVLSSNVIFEVDETNLAPGQDLSVYPGKVFRRQGGAPGQALFATKYPNVTNECMMMFDKARQLADEATGMPSYAHGISGVMSTGRTASGMSMLMGAADQNIKSVIRNIDDYLLVPLGRGLYSFNMQFDFDPEVQGDLDVVAKGTDSLMRNEVRSQKLLQFLQITANEQDAPFVKRDYILRELADSLDLDNEKVVNDPREAGIQANLIKEMREAMGVPPEGAGNPSQGASNVAGVPSVNDSTGNGGGNIAPGAAPGPQEAGFSGAEQPARPESPGGLQ